MLHDLIPLPKGRAWFGYSSFRTMLFYMLFLVLALIVWGWQLRFEKQKILKQSICVVLAFVGYYLLLRVLKIHKTEWAVASYRLEFLVLSLVLIQVFNKDTVRNRLISFLIIFYAGFTFYHDFLPRGVSGYFGFNSIRVMAFQLLIQFLILLGWVRLFRLTKGKQFRFALLVPISSMLYQFIVFFFNAKETSYNEVSVKLLILTGVLVLVSISYFKSKIDRV